MYKVDPTVNPELMEGGRLRLFVHCWLASHLRFFEERERLFGRNTAENRHANFQVHMRLVDAVNRAGLAGKQGETPHADCLQWIIASSKLVRLAFNSANVELITGAALGAGGLKSGLEATVQATHLLEEAVTSSNKARSVEHERLSRKFDCLSERLELQSGELAQTRSELVAVRSELKETNSLIRRVLAGLPSNSISILEVPNTPIAPIQPAPLEHSIAPAQPALPTGPKATAAGLRMGMQQARLVVDTRLTIGAVASILADAKVGLRGLTDMAANNWCLWIKAKSYMRAVATASELVEWSVAISRDGQAAVGPSTAAAATTAPSRSFAVLAIKLEKLVKARLAEEELKRLGKPSRAHCYPLTLGSLGGRITALTATEARLAESERTFEKTMTSSPVQIIGMPSPTPETPQVADSESDDSPSKKRQKKKSTAPSAYCAVASGASAISVGLASAASTSAYSAPHTEEAKRKAPRELPLLVTPKAAKQVAEAATPSKAKSSSATTTAKPGGFFAAGIRSFFSSAHEE